MVGGNCGAVRRGVAQSHVTGQRWPDSDHEDGDGKGEAHGRGP